MKFSYEWDNNNNIYIWNFLMYETIMIIYIYMKLIKLKIRLEYKLYI